MSRRSFTPLLSVRKSTSTARLPKISIVTPSAAADAVRTLVGDSAYEQFVTLYLNVRNTVIGYDVATMHDQAAVSVSAQGIVRTALLSGAIGIITAHQHPSGDPSPSREDRAMWSGLREMAKSVGVTLLDNLVVTSDGYYSEAES